MKCKNCKTLFGLDLDLGFENENVGICSICQKDVCTSCAHTLGIDIREVIDPVLICSGCIRRFVVKAPASAVA